MGMFFKGFPNVMYRTSRDLLTNQNQEFDTAVVWTTWWPYSFSLKEILSKWHIIKFHNLANDSISSTVMSTSVQPWYYLSVYTVVFNTACAHYLRVTNCLRVRVINQSWYEKVNSWGELILHILLYSFPPLLISIAGAIDHEVERCEWGKCVRNRRKTVMWPNPHTDDAQQLQQRWEADAVRV